MVAWEILTGWGKDFWLDAYRTWLYPVLMIGWLLAAYYANLYRVKPVLRHPVMYASILTYVASGVQYLILSLIAGLHPPLKSEDMLPWLLLVRTIELAGVAGLSHQMRRRIREKSEENGEEKEESRGE